MRAKSDESDDGPERNEERETLNAAPFRAQAPRGNGTRLRADPRVQRKQRHDEDERPEEPV